jgi:hypothetical protein
MAANPTERPDERSERSEQSDHSDHDPESPGRSLLDDDDEIVEPNEPA